jgi:hypothetical protein
LPNEGFLTALDHILPHVKRWVDGYILGPEVGEVAGLGDLFAPSINRGTSIAGWFVMDNPITLWLFLT